MLTMMLSRRFTLFLLLVVTSTHAWSTISRRDAMSTLATGLIVGPAAAAHAIDDCPKGSNNCVRTTWTAPSGSSKKDAVSAFRAALDSYPQEGQEGGKVDGGGFVVVEDNLDAGSARVEFKSSGKGNFAKFLNGGKPFTDDLNVEVEDNGTIQIRSASRVGDSDFGVNSKRVEFLANAIKAKGWSV
jgi:hypothetical protein